MSTHPNQPSIILNLPLREPIILNLKEARVVFDELWYWLENHPVEETDDDAG